MPQAGAVVQRGSQVDNPERDAFGDAVGLVRRIELAQRLLDEAFDGLRRNPDDLRGIGNRLAARGSGHHFLLARRELDRRRLVGGPQDG